MSLDLSTKKRMGYFVCSELNKEKNAVFPLPINKSQYSENKKAISEMISTHCKKKEEKKKFQSLARAFRSTQVHKKWPHKS